MQILSGKPFSAEEFLPSGNGFENGISGIIFPVERHHRGKGIAHDFFSKTALLSAGLFLLILSVPAEERKGVPAETAAAQTLTDLKEIEVKDSVVFHTGSPSPDCSPWDSLKDTEIRPLEKVFPPFFYKQLTAAPFRKESMLLELRNGLFQSVRVKANDGRATTLVISLLPKRRISPAALPGPLSESRTGIQPDRTAARKFISYHPNGNPFFTAEYQNGENFGVMRRFRSGWKTRQGVPLRQFHHGHHPSQAEKMNAFHEIDLTNWNRLSKFRYYRQFENQLFNITLQANAGALFRFARERRPLLLSHDIVRHSEGAQSGAEMRRRITEEERVIEFEHVAALTTIMTAGEEFTMALTEYADRFDEFLVRAAPAVEAAKQGEIRSGGPQTERLHLRKLRAVVWIFRALAGGALPETEHRDPCLGKMMTTA